MSIKEEYQHRGDDFIDFRDPLTLSGMMASLFGEEMASNLILGAERNPVLACVVIIVIIILPFVLQHGAAFLIGDSTDLLVEIRMGKRYFENQSTKSKKNIESYVKKSEKFHGDVSSQTIGRVSDLLRVAAANKVSSEEFDIVSETLSLVLDHIRRFGPASVTQSFVRGLARACKVRDHTQISPLVSAQFPNLPIPTPISSGRADLLFREHLAEWVENERFSRQVQGCDGPTTPTSCHPPSEQQIRNRLDRLRAGDSSPKHD